MPVTATVADTPRYALIHRRRPRSPEVGAIRSATERSAIRGFSGTDIRDRFCGISSAQLPSYPLGGSVLRDRANAADGSRTLWVMGIIGAVRRSLSAATLRVASAAHELNSLWPGSDGRFSFDRKTNACFVDETSV
ncbi:MAG TPA: hypothetical protein EYG03_11160 [Planctomycetes bacterium]|nr:hypothetical protein [Fuerstiella sp.]HIK92525.1 hypothetical protein [Planctomycetota bacterium]